MNLKPFRIYGEEEVINGLFTLNTASGDKGNFVTIVAAASGWINGRDFRDIALTSQANVVSNWRALRSEVALSPVTQTNTSVLGIMLRDVRATNYLGVSYLWDATRKAESEVVLSGEAIPILTRGIVLVSGFTGAGVGATHNLIGSGAIVGDVVGTWKVHTYGSTSCGKFLGCADADGYALFKLEL